MAKKKPASGNKKSLVIVESPAKARTIGRFLGPSYTIEASIGHVRDLPQGAKELPEQYKGEDWAYLGVNVRENFSPVYIVPRGKSKQVQKLKGLLKGADELYLATDEDREGEAISWHLCQVLKPKVPVRRLVFHEITKEAILGSSSSRARLTSSCAGPGDPADHRPPLRLRSLSATGAKCGRSCRPARVQKVLPFV